MTEPTVITNPPLDVLLRLANEAETKKIPIEEYMPVLLTLKKKGYTLANMVTWLKDHGAGSYASSTLSKALAEEEKRRQNSHEITQ